MLDTAGRVKDPADDIATIFNKITNWKQAPDERGRIRDLDQQEKFVAAALRNSGKNKVAIHNVKTLRAKMKEIQQDIGLTDDEVNIIVFTSLDHEFLNNLIVLAGEFTKWFNINFEGESRDEIDFRDNKNEIWQSTMELAKVIINEYSALTINPEVIVTKQWWSQIRFKKFGNAMGAKFRENPKLMQTIRQLFQEQNDKLSYYNLFHFIEFDLKLKLQNWEEDAIESRLDRLGMAFIEFNEFNEFCMEYGIDFGEPLLETDLEDILDEKINLSYQDYKVTKKDWYNNVSTILTSEKAALNFCETIW